MDDEIIYSWCFNDVECFDSTPSAAIIILDKDLESFSSLRSQHNATATPLKVRVKFTNEGDSRVNSTEYISLIGSLRYLSHTRPDLLFSVGILSRYMKIPNQEHYNGVKRVLRYVNGIEDYILLYKRGESNAELIGYINSDFEGDCNDQKSTSGHIFFFEGMAVSWSSQKQSIVTLSSCEAEYIAAATATCQAVWMNRLISELTDNGKTPVNLMVDNQSAITLRKNPVHHNRTKHIDTRYHCMVSSLQSKIYPPIGWLLGRVSESCRAKNIVVSARRGRHGRIDGRQKKGQKNGV